MSVEPKYPRTAKEWSAAVQTKKRLSEMPHVQLPVVVAMLVLMVAGLAAAVMLMMLAAAVMLTTLAMAVMLMMLAAAVMLMMLAAAAAVVVVAAVGWRWW
jgi:hypothetical protein